MDPVAGLLLRTFLAGLFGTAAWHKLRGPAEFRAALAAYGLIPAWAVPASARLLPCLELATALALVTPGFDAVAPIAGLSLLALYSGAIAVNLARGRREIDCGCGGPSLRQPLRPSLLARNALLVGVAILCLFPVRARPLAWVDGVSFAFGLLVLVALYASGNRLLANAPALARLRNA